MQLMATIKDGVVLRVAASELSGRLDIMKASDNLTFLAEVIIQQAIDVARAELVSRHGVPGGENPGFAVMGYGKLGGIELGYGSDLDLVFVYSGAEGETSGPRQIDNARFFARLAQRVVHILGTNVCNQGSFMKWICACAPMASPDCRALIWRVFCAIRLSLRGHGSIRRWSGRGR